MSVEALSPVSRTRKFYPVRTKLSAVRDRFIHELSYDEVLQKYQICGSTFYRWIEQYKSRILSEQAKEILSLPSTSNSKSMASNEQKELNKLRIQVANQKLLIEAYEIMMELAKERYHLDVKKTTRRCYRKD